MKVIMTSATNGTTTEEIAKKVLIATAATILGGNIGSILLPGPGTALGAKIGALFGGNSGS